MTDPGPSATTYVPDDLGRRTEVHSPDAGITVYAHDPAGNVVSRADANGATATYGYDALNRLTSVVFPDSSQNLSYGYDAGTYGKGRLTSATDPAGSAAFVHDALGRVTTEDRVTDGVAYQTVYAYDPSTGDLSGMTYPSGLTVDFQHDANGRVFGISSSGQTLVGNVAYKPFGPVKSMDLGPLALTRTYDQRYQITGIQAGTVLNYGYAHDGAGNVETISGLPKPELPPRQTDVAYTGNRLTSIDTLWTIPPDYPATGASYAYDNAGNITSDGLHTDYFYNQNNRLIRMEIDGLTIAEYAYDAFEQRVKKVVNGVTTHFHYDLNGLLISETDGNGNPRKDYVYLNGEPVAMKTYGGSAGWYWFVNDHLGTPQKMVDESGSVVWAAAYAPFGEARVYVDEVTNNIRFPGQYHDVETGLHYNWHRYYDPETGRYLTPDPIGLAGGINPYVYALNNPSNLSDPLGLKATAIPGGTPLPFPGAHPVFQPGTPENQLIGNDLRQIIGLMDPRPMIRDLVFLSGDDLTPTIEVSSGPKDCVDFSNSPESCRLQYEMAKEGCRKRAALGKENYTWCMFKATLAFYWCLRSNI